MCVLVHNVECISNWVESKSFENHCPTETLHMYSRRPGSTMFTANTAKAKTWQLPKCSHIK